MDFRRHWSEEEDELISTFDGNWGNFESFCKMFPGRTERGCRERIKLLRHNYPNYRWLSNELFVLTELCRVGTPTWEFSTYLPDRTSDACRKRLNQPKTLDSGDEKPGRKWTEQEEQKLIEHRKAKKTWFEISKALGGAYSHIECRTHWFNNFWKEYNDSIVNGRFDIVKFKEAMNRGDARPAIDGEANAERVTATDCVML